MTAKYFKYDEEYNLIPIYDDNVIEVVRCRKCKHWKEVKKSVVGGLCYYHGQEFGPDDYCSYGDKEEK